MDADCKIMDPLFYRNITVCSIKILIRKTCLFFKFSSSDSGFAFLRFISCSYLSSIFGDDPFVETNTVTKSVHHSVPRFPDNEFISGTEKDRFCNGSRLSSSHFPIGMRHITGPGIVQCID